MIYRKIKQWRTLLFGTKNCSDKKAQRYYKERGIKFQFIDMNEMESKRRWGIVLVCGKIGSSE